MEMPFCLGGWVSLSKRVGVPARPNYPVRHPKYHLMKTRRPLMEVYWGWRCWVVSEGRCSTRKGSPTPCHHDIKVTCSASTSVCPKPSSEPNRPTTTLKSIEHGIYKACIMVHSQSIFYLLQDGSTSESLQGWRISHCRQTEHLPTTL